MSIFTAFTIASILTTQIVTYALTLSSVYSRYLYGATHDFSGMSKEQLLALKAAFGANAHILDPPPKELLDIKSSVPAAPLEVRQVDAVDAAYVREDKQQP